MPALISTDYTCRITWLGAVMDRPEITIDTQPLDSLQIGWDGVPGAAHSGRTRPSDSRVLQQHKKGTEIANVRPVSYTHLTLPTIA